MHGAAPRAPEGTGPPSSRAAGGKPRARVGRASPPGTGRPDGYGASVDGRFLEASA